MSTEVRIENKLPADPDTSFIMLGNINAEDDEFFDLDLYGNSRGEPSTVLTTLNKKEATQLRDALTAFIEE